MVKLLLAVLIVWVLLAPPLFTGGDCTREFDAAARRVESDRALVATLPQARQYWSERRVRHGELSLDQCRRARMRFIEHCGPGAMLYAQVPVENLVCRLYRDDAVTVQLHYTEKEKLSRVQVDMAPYKSLPIPMTESAIHWGR